jgi:parvulin-like peptidyl-prolyl isomerase
MTKLFSNDYRLLLRLTAHIGSLVGHSVIGHWTFLVLFALGASLPAFAATNETETTTNRPTIAGLFDDPVIARAKGVEVKLSQLENSLTAYKARLAERKQSLPEAQRPLVERQLLEDLLVSKILVLRAKPEDIDKARQRTQQIITEYMTNSGSEEALRRQLKLRDTTLEKFTLDFLEQETARAVMDRELKSKVSVSDAQVQEFYTNGVDAVVKIMQQQLERLVKDPQSTPGQLAATKTRINELKRANLAKLQFPERVRVAHVLISTLDRQSEKELPEPQKKARLALAQQVLAKARAGENFTNLVEKYSEDRNLPQTHGEYIFSREEPYALEFKSASFSLTNNQISDIVTTIFGYHVIKQLELLPPKKVEFDKAAPEIRKALLDQEFEQRIPEFFSQVKREAAVEILDAKYRFTGAARDLVKPGS